MKKYKNAREILLDIFTGPDNKSVSLVPILVTLSFLFASSMETIEFYFTHVFHLGEYIKEVTVLYTPLMAIYTTETLGRKYMDKNTDSDDDNNKT